MSSPESQAEPFDLDLVSGKENTDPAILKAVRQSLGLSPVASPSSDSHPEFGSVRTDEETRAQAIASALSRLVSDETKQKLGSPQGEPL